MSDNLLNIKFIHKHNEIAMSSVEGKITETEINPNLVYLPRKK